ncbi:MAG: hypothetical protein P8Y53_09700 [Pseudolabrys sp.]
MIMKVQASDRMATVRAIEQLRSRSRVPPPASLPSFGAGISWMAFSAAALGMALVSSVVK